MKAEMVSLDELAAYPKNAKSHDLGSIHISIETFGYVERIVINEVTGHILSGHGRTDVLRQLKSSGKLPPDGIIADNGHWMIPVDFVSIPEGQEGALTIALNKTVELGGWDEPALAALLQEVAGSDEIELIASGFSGDDLDQLLQDLGMADEPTPDPGAQIDRAAQLQEKWQVVRGDVWEIGKHTIMCGDSTCADDVERLMGGVKADMVFTSPPYNSGGQGTGAHKGNKIGRTDFKNQYNSDFDNLSSSDYKRFIFNVLNCVADIVNDNSPIMWNVSYNAKSRSEYGHIVFSDDHPFDVRETIIWDKSVGFNVPGPGILSRTCEFIFILSIDKKYFTNQTKFDTWWNVWRINPRDGDNMQNGHGASFPVDLPIEGITKFCVKGGAVYDPFLGSGTTLVACEQTERVGYGMEIAPEYVSVCLERLSAMGLTPERVTDNQPTETGR